MAHGLYLHIPFCLSKCKYCNLNPYPTSDGVPESHVDALLADARAEPERWVDCEFASVYCCGGTPSLLTRGQFDRLISVLMACYRILSDAEIAVE